MSAHYKHYCCTMSSSFPFGMSVHVVADPAQARLGFSCHPSNMLSKNKRPYDPEALSANKRLKANVQDIVANTLL